MKDIESLLPVSGISKDFNDWGTVLLKGALTKDFISPLRDKIVSILIDKNIIDDSSRKWKAHNTYISETSEEYSDIYKEIFTLPELHHLKMSSVISKLGADLLDSPVFVHPNITFRISCPVQEGRNFTTRSHQDFITIQGDRNTTTLWFPLFDTTIENGVLSVAKNSYKNGILDLVFENCGTKLKDEDLLDWHAGNLRAGDIIAFNSLTAHRAMPNISNKVRVSIDLRLQKVKTPISESAVVPFPAFYKNWKDVFPCHKQRSEFLYSTDLVDIIPHSEEYDQARIGIVFSEAKKNNIDTLEYLRKISKYHSIPKIANEAKSLLDEIESKVL
ncbi:phytanoyl-CoA dioxygenase family protein [Candidatus Sororendozoicomonas aggregata]|uniref:phytanoyl-CoA dioxygenase family protein n=1 Tax=Candidatus Sororendozoicomonas aggregata TaxID=3073239 RepID=UPI002ED17484